MDRYEMAAFLRSRRARLRPGDVGLAAGARRRTPGLRRAEVASLAGVSVEYYIRLEQGRGPHPSRQVLDALARALRLPGDERAYLFRLAGHEPGPPPGPPREVTASVAELLASLHDIPALVIDAKHDVLAWNPMAAALFTDFSALPSAQRNLFRQVFTNPAARASISHDDLTGFARDAVADLRAAVGRYPRDPGIRTLISDLQAASPDFAALWEQHDVQARHHHLKRMRHPVVGPLELNCQVLHISEADQRLLLYTAAPGTSSHAALALLKVIGTQDMTPPAATPGPAQPP